MEQQMQEQVVAQMKQAIKLMDDFLRNRIDKDGYLAGLKQLSVDEILQTYADDFKKDAACVYCLDALMMLSSLQHELDFQINEYGAGTASEDIKMLNELIHKIRHRPAVSATLG